MREHFKGLTKIERLATKSHDILKKNKGKWMKSPKIAEILNSEYGEKTYCSAVGRSIVQFADRFNISIKYSKTHSGKSYRIE